MGESDAPLEMEMYFKNISIMFGQYDTDVIIEGTMGFDLDFLGDEFGFLMSMDINAKNDIAFPNLLNLKLDAPNRD